MGLAVLAMAARNYGARGEIACTVPLLIGTREL